MIIPIEYLWFLHIVRSRIVCLSSQKSCKIDKQKATVPPLVRLVFVRMYNYMFLIKEKLSMVKHEHHCIVAHEKPLVQIVFFQWTFNRTSDV